MWVPFESENVAQACCLVLRFHFHQAHAFCPAKAFGPANATDIVQTEAFNGASGSPTTLTLHSRWAKDFG